MFFVIVIHYKPHIVKHCKQWYERALLSIDRQINKNINNTIYQIGEEMRELGTAFMVLGAMQQRVIEW